MLMKSKSTANRALVAEKSKLTKLFTLLTILTLGFSQMWGVDYEVYFVKFSENPGAQSTAFTGAPSDGGNLSATFTVDGTEYSCTRRTSNGKFSISFELAADKTARLWAVHNQSSRHFTLSGSSSGSITAVTASTGFSCSTSNAYADVFDISTEETYTLSNSANIGLVCLILKIEDAGGGGDPIDPTITFNDGAYTLGGSALDLSTLFTSNSDGAVTYSIKTDGGTSASIDGVNFTATAAGTATVTATQAAGTGFNAGSAEADIVVALPDPCSTHLWFVATADATANGKTNWDGFTNAVTGSNSQSNSVTIDGTTYTLTKRTGSTGGGGTILGFTIPANKAGTLYGYMKSSGSAARVLSLKKGDDVVMTNDEIGTGGNWTLITMSNIAPGTYTLSPDQNVQVQMFALKVCDATFHTITLDLDGGTGATSIQALDGVAATKPADPTKDHCAFAGWYSGVDAYDWTTVVTAPFTLTAHWTQLYTISFANGGGSGDAPAAIADKAQGETFQVPANTFTAPSASQEFDIWNDGTNDYAPGATYTVGTENVILTAQWKALVAKYTVIFKDGETTLDTKLVDVGSNPSDAGVDKTKALSTFAAWQKDAADIALDDAFWATVAANAEITLTARWTKAFAANIDFEAFIDAQTTSGNWQAELAAKNYAISSTTSVTLDAPDGKPADKGLKIKNSGAYISFNVNAGKLVLLKAGVLSGAEASVDGGANYTALTGASGSTGASVVTPLYNATEAEYRIRTTTGSYNIIQSITITNPYTVTFEAHGDADPSPLNGTPSVTLPDATNGTASLLGWFDAETGGNKIGNAGATYIPTANITLHAQWEAVSSDNTLSDLKVGGVTVDGFDPAVHTYYVVLPYGTAVGDIPAISATANSAKAKQVAIEQAVWTGDPYNCYRAQANVQAEDESWGYYDVRFSFAPKDGASIFKAELTSATTATYSGIYADADNSQIKLADDGANGYKFGGTSNFIKMALDGGPFATGDLLTMTYSKDPQQGELAIYENTTKIVGTSFENHTLEFTAGADGLTELFIRRTSDNNFNGWVSVVEVTRVVNPMLTAITFAGEAGTINESLKTVTVTVPNATDLGSMTVVPTIVRNAPHASTPEAVITNAGAWVEGPNTYRIMDKDGDYTDYTVTITRAALSDDATLSSLTVNGQAVALADGVFDYSFELPYGTSSAPAVVATPHHVAAVATVDPCTLSGATITVVPESGVGDQKVYTLTFTISPWKEVVIWDGSYMTDVETSPDATGLAWTVNGFGGISNYNATCGTEAYTKCLKSGGAASASRNVELVVPTGYIAKFYIVVGTHEDGTERGMFIGTAATKTLDASSILEINNSVRTEPSAGTSEIAGAGTWYINPEASVDFYEIRAYLRPGYARTAMLGNGVLGTICVPNNVAVEDIQGATFYELAGKNAEGKIAFDQITTGQLDAGKPYVFQANGDKLVLYYGNEHEDNPVDLHNGMYGTFTDLVLTELDDVYYFAQKALWSCTDLTNLSIPANRAYVKLSEIPSAMAPAPGRIRMTLNVNGAPQVTTGMEEITNDQSQMANKVIIDGRLFILRGEKLYDATGRLVK